MPYKDFQNLTVLDETDLDLLMSQGVIRFDSAAQRDATLPNAEPGVVTRTMDNGVMWTRIEVGGVRYWAPAPGTLVALLYANAVQPVASSTNVNVYLPVADRDVLEGHTPGATTTRYNIQVPGWYQVSGGVGFAGAATPAGYRKVGVNKNGINILGSATLHIAGSTSEESVPTRATAVYCAAGDYLELIARHTQGATVNTLISSLNSTSAMVITYQGL